MTAVDAAEAAAARFNQLVAYHANEERIRQAARARVRMEAVDFSAVRFRGLDTWLDEEYAQLDYRIDELLPSGARIVLAAPAKAGKSTLVGNLIRSLVDGSDFLNRFPAKWGEGRVVLIDNELDERRLQVWLRDQDITRTEQVAVVALRGHTATFNVLDKDIRAGWATALRKAKASVLILDCFRPLMDALGLNEHTEAGRLLEAIDALKTEADIGEVIVVHHMGHGAERSRGDSRIIDWPDATWKLVRQATDDGETNEAGPRYFSAYGRDVDVPEGLLTYNHDSRRLTFTGGSRRQTAADGAIPDVLDHLEANPGASLRAIETALADRHPRGTIRNAVRRAVEVGQIDTAPGPRRSTLHMLAMTP